MIWKHKKGLGAVAASIAVAAAVLGVMFLGRTAPPVYAIEQTIEAYRNVKTLHLAEFVRADLVESSLPDWDKLGRQVLAETARTEDGLIKSREVWAELDEDGNLLHLRMDWPVTVDGHKVVLWEQDQAQVWLEQKKKVVIVREKEMVNSFSQAWLDPVERMGRLQRQVDAGEAVIETRETSHEDFSTRLAATYPQQPDKCDVYVIDNQTRLLREIEAYRLENGEWQLRAVYKFLDYNEPVGAQMWRFDLAQDVTVIDQVNQVIGWPQGDMTDEEAAVETVRQFGKALVARDYKTAGQILSGMPANKIEESLRSRRFTRVLSVGDARPQPIPLVGGYVVAFEIEVTAPDGSTFTWKRPAVAVRPAYKQPDRWVIHGGI